MFYLLLYLLKFIQGFSWPLSPPIFLKGESVINPELPLQVRHAGRQKKITIYSESAVTTLKALTINSSIAEALVSFWIWSILAFYKYTYHDAHRCKLDYLWEFCLPSLENCTTFLRPEKFKEEVKRSRFNIQGAYLGIYRSSLSYL